MPLNSIMWPITLLPCHLCAILCTTNLTDMLIVILFDCTFHVQCCTQLLSSVPCTRLRVIPRQLSINQLLHFIQHVSHHQIIQVSWCRRVAACGCIVL